MNLTNCRWVLSFTFSLIYRGEYVLISPFCQCLEERLNSRGSRGAVMWGEIAAFALTRTPVSHILITKLSQFRIILNICGGNYRQQLQKLDLHQINSFKDVHVWYKNSWNNVGWYVSLYNHTSHVTVTWSVAKIRGSFQNFCTLYVFSLKVNLFYKIHLQAFNVISIVLCYSGPTFGQVLYSCQDAFVANASDYSGHLVRHLLNAS